MVNAKRIVVLIIPAAKDIPTEYDKERFLRIGSSKEILRKYPQREAALWMALAHGLPSLTNTDSERQELEFNKLFLYYGAKNKKISRKNFKKNLQLVNEETGKFNLLGLLLADENSRILERNDKYLFDNDAFREALINAFVHNNWQYLNAPQISVYSDRIEILSHGTMGPDQTFEGFFNGESKPVNPALAHILMQLEISDRSGKGVPTIIDRYGKECYVFGEDSITVTIPFVKFEQAESKNDVKEKIIDEIAMNPKITASKLTDKLGLSIPNEIEIKYNSIKFVEYEDWTI